MFEKGLSRARALVVDGNSLSRSLIASQLRELGVEQVEQSARLADARLHVERSRFDIILCDYHFDGSEATGQDFLDELRRERLLPWSTVFIMVTGEATYARVVEAAESALDGYLIKPYRPTALAERIVAARQRKQELAALLQALDRQDWAQALFLSSERLDKRQPYWPYAARLAAELHLQEGDATAAKKLFAKVRGLMKDPAWARLGMARAELALGHVPAARQLLLDLRKQDPGFADTFDVLGRLELDSGDLEGALATFRAASQITPGCLVRLQQTGNAAFMCGQSDEALDLLERTVSFGLRSKLFDPWTLMLLALLRHDSREARPLTAATEQLAGLAARQQGPERLRRLWLCAKGLQRLLANDVAEAMTQAQNLSAQPLESGLDSSIACAALALLARFPPDSLADVDAANMAEPLVLRFVNSRSAVQVLSAYARPRPALVDLVQRCHRDITRMAEQAMEHALQGQPEGAVQVLVEAAERTANKRLIELASTMWARHQTTLGDAGAPWLERIEALFHRYAVGARPVAPGEPPTTRTPGGMALVKAPLKGAAQTPVKTAQLALQTMSALMAGSQQTPIPALPLVESD